MCGIAGFISLGSDSKFCEDIIHKTLQITRYRGPDQQGIFSDRVLSWNVCLGINRLAIIDVSHTGDQPMRLENLTIVYNGEIYNYLELKDDLIKRNHKFIGNSDTEVILHAFKEWGMVAIQKFIGMFSIAIFDKANSKLYIFRDRVGEKPLYYYYDASNLFFSSELKGILVHNFIKKEFDKNMVFNYFIFHSVPSPHTLFAEIKQIVPGEVLIASFNSDKIEIKTSKYWDLPELTPDYALTQKKVLSELSGLIYDAVKIRLRSDVPIGIFLSGGIDSSLIAAVASRISPFIKTFTIGYHDRKHDESRYADFVTRYLKIDNRNILLDEEMADINFNKISYVSDDCTADISLIPQLILAKEARRDVKVALTGAGGDEFFCGYTKSYKTIAWLFRYRKFLKLLAPLFKFYNKVDVINEVLSGASNIDTMIAQFLIRNRLEKIRIFFNESPDMRKAYERIDIGTKLRLLQKNPSFWTLNYYEGGGNYLTHTVLKVVDRATMFHSLEARSVFTDHRIIEYMACVPEKLILKDGIDKFLLRAILSQYLPKRFAFSRVKKGFSVPLASDYNTKWLRSIDDASSIFLGLRSDFFNKMQLEKFLRDRKTYSFELKSRLVFLANFIKIWGIN